MDLKTGWFKYIGKVILNKNTFLYELETIEKSL